MSVEQMLQELADKITEIPFGTDIVREVDGLADWLLERERQGEK